MRNLTCFALLLAASSCDKPNQASAGPAPVFNPVPIPPASQADVEALTKRVEYVERSINRLDPSSDLKLSEQKFSTIRTEYGAITLTWTAASENGAGSKLTFKIGNPHDAKLNDIELYVIFIGADGKDLKSKTYKLDLSGSAPAGSWKELTAIVDDLPPNKIATIRVSSALVGGLGLSIAD